MDTQPEQASLPHGPLAAYRASVVAGALVGDASQLEAAERLQDLWIKLHGYDPAPRAASPSALRSLFRRLKRDGASGNDRPRGIYLAGEVGRGKSMLMD